MVHLEKLIEAAKAGDLAAVRAIVTQHPRVITERLPSGESPVMAALYRGHGEVARALIALGAELDVFAAAALGNVPALREALRQPGAANAFAYDGWTPLHLAAFFGQLDAARALVDAGAELHAISRNSMKNTPLHAAAAGKHEAIALLLLDRGARPDIVDGGGYTARRIAEENELARVLEHRQIGLEQTHDERQLAGHDQQADDDEERA